MSRPEKKLLKETGARFASYDRDHVQGAAYLGRLPF
jgi:hypothetical protein